MKRTIKRIVSAIILVAVLVTMTTIVFAAPQPGTASPNVVDKPVVYSTSLSLGGGVVNASLTTSARPDGGSPIGLASKITGTVYSEQKDSEDNDTVLIKFEKEIVGFGTVSVSEEYKASGKYAVYGIADYYYGTTLLMQLKKFAV